MICPIKNKHWNELVEKYGDDAYIINRMGGVPSSSTFEEDSPVFRAIYNKVSLDPEYYSKKYAPYLQGKARDGSPLSLTRAFFYRVDKYKNNQVIDDHIVGDTSISMFPTTSEEFRKVVNVPNLAYKVLSDLKNRFNIDFTLVDDPDLAYGGKYVNVDGQKHIIINVSKARLDTLFHEYYHPFVRQIKNANPALYESLLQQANATTEEQLVQRLGEMAADKYPSSFLARFLAIVNKLLEALTGKTYNLTGKSTLEEVVQYLMNENVDVSAENTLMTAYQAKKIYEGAEKIEREKFAVDIMPILKAASKEVKTNDDTVYYYDLAGNIVGKRLTSFVGDKEEGEFSKRLRDKPSSYTVYEARKIYAENRLSESEPISYQDKMYTFDELVAKMEQEASVNRLYGKAGHAYFQYLTETDPILKAEAKSNFDAYSLEMAKAGKNIRDLSVVENDYSELLNLIGVETGDRVSSEIALLSQELTTKDGNKIGTTADGVVQHANGEITLFDLKFGNIASDMFTNRMMEYGAALGVRDSKVSRAYLELAFRAMMLKEQFPDVKFRAIKLVKVDSNSDHREMELDLSTYLEVIASYYAKTNPALHESLEAKGLFNVQRYQGQSAVLNKYMKTMQDWSLATKLEYVENKLKALTLYTNRREKDSTNVKEERAVLAKLYQELIKSPEVNLKREGDDISAILGDFKNFSDIAHPQVQALHGEIQTVRSAMKKEFNDISNQEQKLFKDVLTEAAPSQEARNWIKKMTTGGLAAAIVGVGVGLPFWLIGVPLVIQLYMYRYSERPKDLFAFMWRKDSGASKGYYLNTADTYSKNGTEVALTAAQKAYRTFIVETMHEKYKSLMQTKAFNSVAGKPLTYAQILEMPDTLPEDFLPRVPKSTDELRLEQDFSDNFMGIKTRAKDFVRNHFTSFFEDGFENNKDKGGLPVRYYKHAGSPVVETGEHSFNVSQAFNMFMGSMLTKEYYDPLAALAYGVRDSIELAKDESGKQKYPNLSKWLDKEIMLQILKEMPRDRATTKEIKFTVGKWGAPILQMKEGTTLILDQHRAIMALKGSVSFLVMSFRAVSATFNAGLITLTNAMNESKAVLGSIMGVPPEYVHAKAGTTLKAYNDYKNYIAGEMTGKGSKLGKIAENFDWMPDSYEYDMSKGNLLYDISSPKFASHAYMFHGAGETWGSMVHLSMMLRSTMVEDSKGNKFSLWDAYGEDGEWTKGTRGVKVVGENTVELKGLDAREIKALKRQYEKLHGSYRAEEKAAIEATVVGQFIMQFKKYFFTYMKNLFASPYTDTTVGRYVIDHDIKRPDGMPTWKWESEIMKGRLKVMAAAVMSIGKWKDFVGTGDSRSVEQRMNQVRMIELINTLIWVLGVTFAIGAAFDDDKDKKTYAYKRMMRLRDDMSQGLAPKDFFAAIQQPVASADKVAKTGKAFFDWITFQTNVDGTPKGRAEISRNVPVFNNRSQISNMFTTSSATQEYLFGIVPAYTEGTNR